MLKLAKRLALVALLIARAGTAAPPVRILIAYHSQTGNTAKLAAAVREGAASVAGVEVLLRPVDEAGTEDIVRSDGILLGTPVHWGNLSAESKRFLDRMGEVLGKTSKMLGEGRTAGVFCTAGSISNGQEMARLAAIAAFLDMRFLVIGGVNDEGFGSLGPQAVTGGSPPGVNDRDRAEARRFGERFARLTWQFRTGAKMYSGLGSPPLIPPFTAIKPIRTRSLAAAGRAPAARAADVNEVCKKALRVLSMAVLQLR